MCWQILIAWVFIILTVNTSMILEKNVHSLLGNRLEACNNLVCDSSTKKSVCGIRKQINFVQFKLFANECALLRYGCSVTEKYAYGLIKMKYCNQSDIVVKDGYTPESRIVMHNLKTIRNYENNNECEINCNYQYEDLLCGIRQDGEGYRIKLFKNTCELVKYNCNSTSHFIETDIFICNNSLLLPNTSQYMNNAKVFQSSGNYTLEKSKSIIIVDGSMLGQSNDPNKTIDNFFAATHVLDLPIKEFDKNELKTRRMLLKNVGPIMVFQPWITIPKKIEEDVYHMPTLSTCFHKCPTKCPDTYSPVCGVPGILAREPSIMFQNHCYLDVAQCKMSWENKSSTAASSSYIESSFLFCLGDQLNGMYRFLPLIKTLQHMGRLKKKGKFRYRLKNMRFFNNYAYKEPKIMG